MKTTLLKACNAAAQGKQPGRFFRPSCLPALNGKDVGTLVGVCCAETPQPDVMLRTMTDTPGNTVCNYFSVLREAANPAEGSLAGCGTIGEAKAPYSAAYRFLTAEAQTKLPFAEYVDLFDHVLHITLIRCRPVPDDRLRYFVELETIESGCRSAAVFAYSYGFLRLEEQNSGYRIASQEYFAENFLCAPYHGWEWSAAANVQIRYGGWCKLICGKIRSAEKNGIVTVCFTGTDGYEYRIIFYRLTNSTDLEIAKYRRKGGAGWKPFAFTPEDCL